MYWIALAGEAISPQNDTVVESNISEVLTDHAWCEQKAASNAISTIVRYPELTDLVEELTRIAMEEMEHFGMVVENRCQSN